MNKSKVIVVMPAYNAETTLKKTVDDIPKSVVDEIILVDDKSKDGTIEAAKELVDQQLTACLDDSLFVLKRKIKLSIIIPVFNEEKTIAQVIKNVNSVKIDGVEKEIIIVNDGSTDNTAIKIKNTKVKDAKIYTHDKNLGKGAAVKTGIDKATGDHILIQDADLEYNPDEIINLISPLQNTNIQVVFGTRLNRLPNFLKDEKTPLFLLHYLGNRLLSLFTSILYGQWLTDMETGYKLLPRKALASIRIQAKSFNFEPEITAKLLKKGYKILEVPITTNPRGYGDGKKLHTFRDGSIALWTLLKLRFFD